MSYRILYKSSAAHPQKGEGMNSGKLARVPLPCILFSDVPCSFRKSENTVFMDRCFKCLQYERFEREMDEEDQKVMDEIERIRKFGYPRRFDVSKKEG
jgi:hypothetical protein